MSFLFCDICQLHIFPYEVRMISILIALKRIIYWVYYQAICKKELRERKIYMLTNIILIICAILLGLQWILFFVMSIMTKNGVSFGKTTILIQTNTDPARALFRNVMIIAFVMFIVTRGVELLP